MSRINTAGGYEFSKATGIAVSKGPNKPGKRPLVVARLEDRIVQRAILDVLQGQPKLLKIRDVLSTPTSIGGIPGRGVDHAIQIIQASYDDGYSYVAGSDIARFFTKIPKKKIFDFVREAIRDDDFSDLFEKALTVELSNTSTLTDEERALFPTGEDGVAQGCPLSSLAGNIVLKEFDRQLNEPGRNIVCVRYIDDFIILGKKPASVHKALQSAKSMLQAMNMDIYDPATDPNKAFFGRLGCDKNLDFLGYQLIPNLYPPSALKVEELKNRIQSIVGVGKKQIRKALAEPSGAKPKTLVHTLDHIDNVTRGWVRSHKSNKCVKTLRELDEFISDQISDLLGYYTNTTKNLSVLERRPALGVSLMQVIHSEANKSQLGTKAVGSSKR